MSHRRVLIPSLAVAAVVFAASAVAAQQTVSQAQRGHLTRLSYGKIERIEDVRLKSQAGKGALVGGLAGLSTGHRKTERAAAGVVVGALLTRAIEKKKAQQFTVRVTDGSEAQIVLDHHTDLEIGDCVVVEDGTTANLRRVSPVLCEENAASHHGEFTAVHSSEADACHKAKMELLDAGSEDDFNRAERKVRVLCE